MTRVRAINQKLLVKLKNRYYVLVNRTTEIDLNLLIYLSNMLFSVAYALATHVRTDYIHSITEKRIFLKLLIDICTVTLVSFFSELSVLSVFS